LQYAHALDRNFLLDRIIWREIQHRLSAVESHSKETMENGYAIIKSGMANGKLNGSNYTNTRPLTVDEALPYSPFSSVVPFNSGIASSLTFLQPPITP
jgi:hypothetical protein